ncbi:MAG: hypothetical protein WD939_09405 [Dehalococcoidia bacterium]
MEATEALAPTSTSKCTISVRQLFDQLADLDFTAPLTFAGLAIAYIASRAYWLDLGYGTDPDAWRVALTADYLWEHGEYLPSRLPGYPLHELVTAAAVQQGWIWTNLSTVFISVVGLYLFALLAKKLDVPHRGILTLGFAFAPLLWVNSVMTMDYMWALTFVLGTYLALLNKQASLAGFLLGIAAGFRLTSLFMLPVFWLLLWRTDERNQIRPMTVACLATTLVAYTLVLMDYGLNFLNFYDEKVHYEEFIKRLGKDGLGIIGGLAVIVGGLLSLPRLRSLPSDLLRDPHVLTWAAAIVVLFYTYGRLPHEIAYLVPVFPFGFFLMARYMSRAVLVGTLAVIVLAGFVDVTTPDDTVGITTETFSSARIGKGMLLSDIETLRNQMAFAHELRALTEDDAVRKPAVVSVGFIYPELVMLYKDELDIRILEEDLTAISQLSDKGHACDPSCTRTTPQIEYVWLLEFDQFQTYEQGGRTMYYTTDAGRSTYGVYEYRPGYFGALELPLSRDNPSLGEGTASTER